VPIKSKAQWEPIGPQHSLATLCTIGKFPKLSLPEGHQSSAVASILASERKHHVQVTRAGTLTNSDRIWRHKFPMHLQWRAYEYIISRQNTRFLCDRPTCISLMFSQTSVRKWSNPSNSFEPGMAHWRILTGSLVTSQVFDACWLQREITDRGLYYPSPKCALPEGYQSSSGTILLTNERRRGGPIEIQSTLTWHTDAF